MLTQEFPVVTSNYKVGLGVFGTADPYTTTGQYAATNGARNPLGALAFFPAPSTNGGYYPSTTVAVLSTAAGYGSGLLCRYVLYKGTASPAMVAGAAPLVYTDETFTIVSGVYSEGLQTATLGASAGAGWLLPNTATTAYGLGTAINMTLLNNSGNGSYIWMAVAGFIPSCYLAAGTIGQSLYAATGNFTTAGEASTSLAHKSLGSSIATITSNIGDVMAGLNDFPIF